MPSLASDRSLHLTGCPIRKSVDHCALAAPYRVSPLGTSFIGTLPLGIPQKPCLTLKLVSLLRAPSLPATTPGTHEPGEQMSPGHDEPSIKQTKVITPARQKLLQTTHSLPGKYRKSCAKMLPSMLTKDHTNIQFKCLHSILRCQRTVHIKKSECLLDALASAAKPLPVTAVGKIVYGILTRLSRAN